MEDDVSFANQISILLQNTYDIKLAYTFKSALELVLKYPFDLVVSDYVLADVLGVELIESIKSFSNPPKIIFMTAFASKDIAITLLNAGASGLIEKPFSIGELINLINRVLQSSENSEVISISKWQIDPASRSMTTSTGTSELTEVEFKLMTYFLNNSDKWISREEIIEQVWGSDCRSRNVLDTHLTNLKKKVPSFRENLKVIRGRGYRIESM